MFTPVFIASFNKSQTMEQPQCTPEDEWVMDIYT